MSVILIFAFPLYTFKVNTLPKMIGHELCCILLIWRAFLFANQLNVTGPRFIAWPISSNCMNLKPQFLLCIAEKLPRGAGTRAFQEVEKVRDLLFLLFFPSHKLVLAALARHGAIE